MKQASALLLFSFLFGCTVGPDFVRPEVPKVSQYTSGEEPKETIRTEGKAQIFDENEKLPHHWWRLFNSEKLDPFVTEALAKNQTLQAALAGLRQSRQNVIAGQGVFYPQLRANGDYNVEKFNPSSLGFNANPTVFNLLTFSASVSYLLDIFGGQRRTVEGLIAQEDLTRYTVLATYLTLTGNLVNTLIAKTAYEEQIDATKKIIQMQTEQVNISAANAKAGTVPYSTLLSLKSQLSQSEATLPTLSQKLSQANHLLATLSGKVPAEWKSPAIRFSDFSLPEKLPKSLPSELVHQRPDVLQAESQLHVASAQIGVATAALFPSFSLNGTAGFNNTASNGIVDWGKSFWNVGASILAPIFSGGTLQAQKQAAVEAFQASFANYKEVVLTGFQQVADTLRALEHDAQFLQAESQALSSSEEALKLIRANYRAGTANYLQLLIANAQFTVSRLAYIQAQAQRLQDTAALYIALGGGWWNAPEKEPLLRIEKVVIPGGISVN